MPERLRWSPFLVLVLFSMIVPSPSSVQAEADPPRVVIEEVVTDPEQDHDGSGSVTTSDEYVVLLNDGTTSIDLASWRLVMSDTTPEEHALEGVVPAGGRHLVLNPRGAMNNDVRLSLYAADDRLVADHALATGDLPGGSASSVHDEAVYLAGPWAGQKAPASLGQGLPALWVEAVATAGTSLRPFTADWLAGGASDLDLVIHRAPGLTDPNSLAVSGRTYPISDSDGTGRAEQVSLDAPEAWFVVRSGDTRVAKWPNGTALVFPVDDSPPLITDAVAVADGTRHLHHVPAASDPQSGASVRDVAGITPDGARVLLDPCMIPTPTTSATCPLPDTVHALRIEATNGAGMTTTQNATLFVDADAPAMPDAFVFETGTPPTLRWDAFDERLGQLVIETSDDKAGTHNVTRVTLASDGRVFTDHAWTPGTPRAYRLVARDLAGNMNLTSWTPLPPAAVPVVATMPSMATAHEDLLANGTVGLAVHVDRPLQDLPVLSLMSGGSEAFDLRSSGETSPDGRVLHYVLAVNGTLPATAHATWRLIGGEGIDGAPVKEVLGDVAWDHEPPLIETKGIVDGWIGGSRHVLTLGRATAAIRPPSSTSRRTDAPNCGRTATSRTSRCMAPGSISSKRRRPTATGTASKRIGRSGSTPRPP